MAHTIDTLAAVQLLQKTGMAADQAEAITRIVDQAQAEAVTKVDLNALRGDLKADLYRALWIQGGGIIAILGVLFALGERFGG